MVYAHVESRLLSVEFSLQPFKFARSVRCELNSSVVVELTAKKAPAIALTAAIYNSRQGGVGGKVLAALVSRAFAVDFQQFSFEKSPVPVWQSVSVPGRPCGACRHLRRGALEDRTAASKFGSVSSTSFCAGIDGTTAGSRHTRQLRLQRKQPCFALWFPS